jgi:flagellar FliL protein
MSVSEEAPNEEPKKSSKKPLVFGLLAALIGGGGGFYATYSGMILGDESHSVNSTAEAHVSELADVAFVEVSPMVISLRPGSANRHLSFRAHLEEPSAHQEDVKTLMPRVVDVLNGYLRALETSDLEDPAALMRLRAQMLRRVQIVAGSGRVNDLLITEFVLN